VTTRTTERLAPTPSQTVGPFYGYALPIPRGGEIAPEGDPRAIAVHGYVHDGAGRPIPDALIEIWQADPEGSTDGAPGSLRREPTTGLLKGRDGFTWTGFGRIATDPDGHWVVRTLPPGAAGEGQQPYLAVVVFARGLLHHLHTRAYLADQVDAGADPLLASLEPARAETLLARPERPGVYRFDIRLQEGEDGAEETVFLDFAQD
jgi:protocatechuate 3,4-dioxygenase alpha subunit